MFRHVPRPHDRLDLAREQPTAPAEGIFFVISPGKQPSHEMLHYALNPRVINANLNLHVWSVPVPVPCPARGHPEAILLGSTDDAVPGSHDRHQGSTAVIHHLVEPELLGAMLNCDIVSLRDDLGNHAGRPYCHHRQDLLGSDGVWYRREMRQEALPQACTLRRESGYITQQRMRNAQPVHVVVTS